MFFCKALVFSAVAALASAQSALLTFTSVPSGITVGQPQTITFATDDTTDPVSIILRQGPSTNLQTIETLTTNAQNGQFIWTPAATLVSADNYALQITQADQVNYFGPFAVAGGAASSMTSASVSASASATASASSSVESVVTSIASSLLSITGSVTILPIPYPTETTAVMNATAIANGTVIVAPLPTASMGTGVALPGNATMSMATLSASGNTIVVVPTPTGAGSTAAPSSGAGTSSTEAPAQFTGGVDALRAPMGLAIIGAVALFL